jgi:hypothetical protein
MSWLYSYLMDDGIEYAGNYPYSDVSMALESCLSSALQRAKLENNKISLVSFKIFETNTKSI